MEDPNSVPYEVPEELVAALVPQKTRQGLAVPLAVVSVTDTIRPGIAVVFQQRRDFITSPAPVPSVP